MNNIEFPEIENYTSICSSRGVGTSKSLDIGYNCAVGAELKLDRWRFHQSVHPETKMVLGDFTQKIDELAELHKIHKCRGMIITLPCQSMSLAGGQHLDDPLTWLFLDALKLIKRIIELGGVIDWLIWENAPYFIADKQDSIITERLNGKTILQHIKSELKPLGLVVNAQKVDASWYGTAQARTRGIVLCKKLTKWEFPKPDKKQLTIQDAIGHFKSLESGERDPDNYFHKAEYVHPRQADFLRRTKTGTSAFSNPNPWKPVNPDGSPSQAQHVNSAFGRESWDRPAHAIIQGSDSICGDWSLHPGTLLANGLYSDPRFFTLAEIFALTGVDERFINAIPAWAKPNDKLLRELCGEALLPNLVNRLLSTLK